MYPKSTSYRPQRSADLHWAKAPSFLAGAGARAGWGMGLDSHQRACRGPSWWGLLQGLAGFGGSSRAREHEATGPRSAQQLQATSVSKQCSCLYSCSPFPLTLVADMPQQMLPTSTTDTWTHLGLVPVTVIQLTKHSACHRAVTKIC